MTGRPILVADSFIDIQKPSNIDDTSYGSCSIPLSEPDHPTTSSAMVADSYLAVIANRIYNTLMSAHCQSQSAHKVLVMEHTLNGWKESSPPPCFLSPDIPDWFLGPRAVLLWKSSNIHILLLIASQRYQDDGHSQRTIQSNVRLLSILSTNLRILRYASATTPSWY